MTLAALLTQSVVVERSTAGAADSYNHAALAWAAVATVRGSIQPRSAREVALQSQAGAAITDAVAYLLPADVRTADRLRLAADASGPWYEVTGVRDAAGRGHHLEIDCRVVR